MRVSLSGLANNQISLSTAWNGGTVACGSRDLWTACALFLTAVALLPIWIGIALNVPFRFGGTSLLIVVGVALDTIQQLNQHLLLRKYDGFMKKGRVRFRGRQGAPGSF